MARDAASTPSVLGFLLPTQQVDRADLEALLARLTAGTAKRLGGSQVVVPAISADLGLHLDRARALALAGAVDEAASAFDAALEEGARSLPRLGGSAPELIAGHLRRAEIALARGERARLGELLTRALRYDPSLRPSPEAASPPLRIALEQARAGASRLPAVLPNELSEACRTMADVILVGRKQGTDELQVMRFDDCAQSVEVTLKSREANLSSESDAVDRLSRATVHLSVAVHARELRRDVVAPPGPTEKRALPVSGLAALIAGVGLVSAGAYFWLRASSQRDDLNRGCDQMTPCTADVLQSRGDAISTSQTWAETLSAVGGAAIVVGALVTYYGSRRIVTRSALPGLSPLAGGAALSWRCDF
jgi:hypothetical protein